MIRSISKEEFDSLSRKPYNTPLMRDIEEFRRSGALACEVVTDGYKNRESCAASYDACAKRLNCGVRVIRRGERVFLVREETK